jgi:hypothetical protein
MTTVAFLVQEEFDEPRKPKAVKTTKAQKGKRNVNGEGNIRERSNGSYEGRLRHHD